MRFAASAAPAKPVGAAIVMARAKGGANAVAIKRAAAPAHVMMTLCMTSSCLFFRAEGKQDFHTPLWTTLPGGDQRRRDHLYVVVRVVVAQPQHICRGRGDDWGEGRKQITLPVGDRIALPGVAQLRLDVA